MHHAPMGALSALMSSDAGGSSCGRGGAMDDGIELRPRWKTWLEDERVDGERGEGRRSSQRFRRVGQWARGEAGAVGAAMEISGVGRLKMTAWRCSGASGVAQLDEEE